MLSSGSHEALCKTPRLHLLSRVFLSIPIFKKKCCVPVLGQGTVNTIHLGGLLTPSGHFPWAPELLAEVGHTRLDFGVGSGLGSQLAALSHQ